MKSTGIVRRIDGLGRVVLPKEIRKTLKLNSGDLLQIFVEKEVIILESLQVIGFLIVSRHMEKASKMIRNKK